MIDDERQRVFVVRANVDEVDVETVDLGHELREGVQPRLDLAPVVLGRPVPRELLHRRERSALRLIRLLLRPLGGHDAPAEVVQRLVGNVDVEGADLDCGLEALLMMAPFPGADRVCSVARRAANSLGPGVRGDAACVRPVPVQTAGRVARS